MREQVSAEVVSRAVHSCADRAHRATLVQLAMVDQRARVLERFATYLAAIILDVLWKNSGVQHQVVPVEYRRAECVKLDWFVEMP